MPGIVFVRTENRPEVVDFYRDRLGFRDWLEQDAGCTVLRYDSLLVGFCDAEVTETEGVVTLVVESEAAVDERHRDLADVARGPPEASEAFDRYRFYLEDPDGRTVEVQTFRHATPPVGAERP